MKQRSLLVLVVICLALTLTACEAGTTKTRKVVPDWSRGQQLGVSALNQPIDIVAAKGQVHVLWVALGGKTLYYVRLDHAGRIEVSSELQVSGAHPNSPKLVLNSDGSFGALWTDNPNIPRALFLAVYSPAGELRSGPVQLSPEGARVADLAVAGNLDGSHEVFWADEIPLDGGIHHLHLSGETASSDRLLIQAASSPSVRTADDGTLHLAWVEEPSGRDNQVYYATLDSVTRALDKPIRIASYRTATGLISYPPRLGLDNERVYLFWALEQRGGGMSPGEAHTSFVSFPLTSPQPVEPATLDIPSMARPSYVRSSGSLPYQRLAMADAGWPTSLLYMPATMSGQNDELGVFLASEVATRNRTSREVVWAIFEDGVLKGYQLPSLAGSALRPCGALDEDDNVHLVWLNAGGFGRYDVYYASTSAAVRASLDRVTLQDRATDLLDRVWSLAPAIGFFPPVFLLWTFASFVWVILYYFVRVEGGMERRGSRIALAIAILLYLFSKLFLMPGVLFYAPFLDRVPQNLQMIPILGTPIFTLLIAVAALWLYSRKREYKSLFAMYLILVVTDALLSMIIYVPRWLEG